MVRVLPVLLEIGLTVYCLVDCVQSPDGAVRNLQKGWWIMIILFFPIVGGIAWLVAGRPTPETSRPYVTGYPEHAPDRRRPLGPDDDPEYLREISRVNSEHERTLKQWEADLARREQELRRRESGEGPHVG